MVTGFDWSTTSPFSCTLKVLVMDVPSWLVGVLMTTAET
jgi:hypothetical protein